MTIKAIHQDGCYVQEEGYVVSDMNGDKVMMSIQSGKYYNLGRTGGRIWELLSNGNTLMGIVAVLSTEYSVDQEKCSSQVEQFLNTLLKEGLIKHKED
ncbi:lasso peptide biosynthesis PqqD family chaperone [Neobacillus mesonae]|nr:lasso peptide biosynthesis PqqD family chaperone [Neobacillus mesonae]